MPNEDTEKDASAAFAVKIGSAMGSAIALCITAVLGWQMNFYSAMVYSLCLVAAFVLLDLWSETHSVWNLVLAIAAAVTAGLVLPSLSEIGWWRLLLLIPAIVVGDLGGSLVAILGYSFFSKKKTSPPAGG